MLTQKFALQSNKATGVILRTIENTARLAIFNKITVAIAYASLEGTKNLEDSLSNAFFDWERVQKHWVLSIDNGITDPQALELLASLPNSKVYIPNVQSVLRANLRPKVLFHNKCYMFEFEGLNAPFGLISTSANLTIRGLHLNNEQIFSSVFTHSLTALENVLLAQVLYARDQVSKIVSEASVLDKNILNLYIEKRLSVSPPLNQEGNLLDVLNEDDPVIKIDKAIALSTSNYFWVEIRSVVQNLGANSPGNQIDLQRGTRVFFGFTPKKVPNNTLFGEVHIRYKQSHSICHMRFGDNSMDKLNLPIPSVEGPPSYENSVLLFERLYDGSFRLTVGTEEQEIEWKKLSTEQDTLYTLRGGRQYGTFEI